MIKIHSFFGREEKMDKIIFAVLSLIAVVIGEVIKDEED